MEIKIFGMKGKYFAKTTNNLVTNDPLKAWAPFLNTELKMPKQLKYGLDK